MSGIQIFENPAFGEVRALNIDGEPWFVGRDVAAALGYSDEKSAVRDHVDSEDKRVMQKGQIASLDIPNRGLTIINESGLYSLILSSKLESAKAFKRWVTSEVLPSIRKTGGYVAGQETMTDAELMASAVLAANRMIEQRDAKISALTADNRALSESNTALRKSAAELKDAAEYAGQVLISSDTLTVTQIAADYDMSARQLNEILHEAKIQHKVNGQWILYKEWMGHGLTESVTVPVVGKDGRRGSKMSTRWTQLGRRLISMVLRRRGYFTKEQSEELRRAMTILFGEDKEGGADNGEV